MRLSHAYLLTVVSLVFGFSMSYLNSDWQWLSRSGSLIVVIGIMLTSTQIIDELHLMRQRRMHSERHQDSWSSHDWVAQAENHKKMRWGDGEFSGRSKGLYLLIFGTLVWGFGDVVGQIL